MAVAQAGAKPVALTEVDSFLAIDKSGNVTVYSGKVDLGTGVHTALQQIVADELDVPMNRIDLSKATPCSRPTRARPGAASPSRSAACSCGRRRRPRAQALVDDAAKKLGVPADQLTVADGVISGGGKKVSYAELIGGKSFSIKLDPKQPVKEKDPKDYKIGRQAGGAPRHPRQGDRQVHLYAGLPRARHVARARGAAAGDRRQARKRR